MSSILWMGSDVCEVQEATLHRSGIKVHLDMCTQLLRLVDRISVLFPDIEAARPRCSSGLQALCLLRNALEKAKTLVQSCSLSSKLYLALTGDSVVSRFEKTRNLLHQSLNQLQHMVPVTLQFEISAVLDDLRDAVFFMNTHEEEAGKALRALLMQDALNSGGTSELEVLQFAALRLHLSSNKDLLLESRSIRNILKEMKEGNAKKRATLRYLLHLLKKYDKLIVQGQTKNFSTKNDASCFYVKSDGRYVSTNSTNLESHPVRTQDNAQARMLHSPTLPEEFKCPLSLKLMYNPVIISSGQTFERTSILKWFEEGHDTCPTTKLKLANLSVTPNTSLRHLILKWSEERGIMVSDLSTLGSACDTLDNSSNSISSTTCSMKDIYLRSDISNISLGSLDSSYRSDLLCAKVKKRGSSLREVSNVSSHRFLFFSGIHDIEEQFLSNIRGLPWELQCRAVQDVKDYLTYLDTSCALLSPEDFLGPLMGFLNAALDKDDAEAQKAGTQLLLTFLKVNRREAAPIGEDLYIILAAFLGTEAAPEVLAIMEVLSALESVFPKVATSGALASAIKFLSDPDKEFRHAVIRILHNLSCNKDTCSCKLVVEWIPDLVPFLKDGSVVGTCLSILNNLCKFEEARVSIAETDGCIGSIIELLETGNCEEQELAVDILLSLCSQREQYCLLVLHEGVIPSLCRVSANGNEKGKVGASELLRQLRDIRYANEEASRSHNVNAPNNFPSNLMEKQLSKTFGFLRKKIKSLWR